MTPTEPGADRIRDKEHAASHMAPAAQELTDIADAVCC